MLLSNTSQRDAWQVAERIRKNFQYLAFHADGKTRISATISLGLVEKKPDETSDSLLERADQALYEAKKRGKNMSFIGG